MNKDVETELISTEEGDMGWRDLLSKTTRTAIAEAFWITHVYLAGIWLSFNYGFVHCDSKTLYQDHSNISMLIH